MPTLRSIVPILAVFGLVVAGLGGTAQAQQSSVPAPLVPRPDVTRDISQPGSGSEVAQQPATGDDQGFVRIQGRRLPAAEAAPAPATETLIDLREEMRKLVLSISRFARKHRPNFRIIVRGGLDLLVKRDDVDETKVSPARTYMRTLDGLLAEGLFFTERRPGRPPEPEIQQRMLGLVDFARKNGIRVFTLDYGEGPRIIDQAREQASKRGFISLVSDRPLLDIAELPSYPKRPPGENSKSVISLDGVKNYAIVANSLPFGREDVFALALHGTNYDMVVVDVFHGRKPLSRQAVETLKYKKIGAKRLVLAKMDVGTAASYRYYWKDTWREGSPPWIAAPVRGDPDRYNVEFWRPGWKKIISGDTNSYVYGIIAQGFDGVLIDGLEVYKFFEGGGEVQDEDQN
ncbi:MAG: hypothetical protein OXR84_13535 [Magnetovibrio sp.]|nr:hypothetical protein [Magnetovibrio sp.]